MPSLPLVAKYVAALRSLAEHCNYADVLNDMLRDRLVCGVNNEKIQQRLLAEKDLTFAKAMELASAIESAEQGSRAISNGQAVQGSVNYQANTRQQQQPWKRNSHRARPESEQREHPGGHKNNPKLVCWRCGDDHKAPECRFKESKCRNCKKTGHLAKMCRKGGQKKQAHYLDLDENEDSYSLYSVRSKALEDAMMISLTLNGVPVSMELDTGAALSLINKSTYQKIAQASQLNPLQPSRVLLKTYTGERINILGTTSTAVRVCCGENDAMQSVHVVEGEGPNLLGRDWISKFQVSVNNVVGACNHSAGVEEILSKHADVFKEELGKLKGFKAKLYIDPDAKPKFCKARPVPFAMKQLVEDELKQFEKDGIISPIQFSPWATPIVSIIKSNGKVRLCGDYKTTINKALLKDSYPLPLVEELFASLAGGKHFTKLDLSQAYLQIELDDESKKLATINTQRGLFQFNRLPYGVSSSPAIFQRCMESLVQGCKGVVVYIDDILLTGTSGQEHLETLNQVLGILDKAGIRLNRPKCFFMRPSVEYLGHIIDENGIHPTDEKVRAIKEAPRPTNVTELRAFLGIINYYGKFLANLSSKLAPLHELLQKRSQWHWTDRQDKAFQAAKDALQSDSLLVHYDGSKPLVLACDASPRGLGAVLSHIMPDGSERPVAYASRTLSAAERNYSQLEKEGLAVVYGVKKFHKYLFGRHFSIESDHQPLSHLFGESREIPLLASSRIQRWALTLSAYQYSIKYKAGQFIGNADALSRLPRPQTTSSDCLPGDLVHLVNHLSETAVNASQIRTWTDRDPTLSLVRKYLQSGWPQRNLAETFKPYKSRFQELSLLDGCVLWGARVIVPPPGRKLVLEELHETHPGVSKMKALARSYVWWPKMDGDIEDMVKNCTSCQVTRPSPPTAQLHPWEWPDQPWSRLHIDFAGPFMGRMFLILVDSHSKWLDVQVMQSISSNKTIEKLRVIFATHGLPHKVVSDNGPSFTSEEFKKFMKANGIKHITSAPYHPSTNGLAERAVQTVKQGLRQMQGGTVEEKLARFLMKYRITPHSTTGISPSELLMGRRLRSRLDILHPDLSGKVEDKQWKQKLAHDNQKAPRTFEEGDAVFAEDFTASSEKWLPGVIQKVTGPLSYRIQLADGRVVRRHVDNVRARSHGKRREPDNGVDGERDIPDTGVGDTPAELDDGVGWEHDIPALVDIEPEPPNVPVVQDVAASPTANRPASPISIPIASPNASPIASSPGPDVVPVRQSVRPKKPPDYYRS